MGITQLGDRKMSIVVTGMRHSCLRNETNALCGHHIEHLGLTLKSKESPAGGGNALLYTAYGRGENSVPTCTDLIGRNKELENYVIRKAESKPFIFISVIPYNFKLQSRFKMCLLQTNW